jgi:uracil-DNA glycosylase family 4
MDELNRRIVACETCPRLRAHCLNMAEVKRASFRDQTYFARPLPNFGDPEARLLVIGLAPAAHGGNRTGRMFTGDRSGDFLYAAMYAAGFANQPTAIHAGDGLELRDVMITAACHCAPPDNKPTPEEIGNCAPFLDETFALLPRLGVVLCLGKIGYDAVLRYYRRRGWIDRLSPYAFGHGAEHPIPGAHGAPVVLCSYHPSQQNTFTGKLTAPMMRAVFERARAIIATSEQPPALPTIRRS